jgi:phage replication initiation protein
VLSRPARAGRPAPPPFGKHGGANHTFHSMGSMDSMTSPFTLTIDWLAFTLPTASSRETMEVLGGDWTKTKGGFRGYRFVWITTSTGRGIGKLGTGVDRNPGEVHVDLSGGLVAQWPPEKVRAILQWVLHKNGHLTRLDCALDDRVSSVSLTTIKDAVAAGQCVTRAKCWQKTWSGLIHEGTATGETVYLGSRQSQTLLRIYDKRLQMQAQERLDWHDYGIRWELELKQDRAQLCGQMLSYLDDTHWLEFIVGVLRSHIDFRNTQRDEPDEYRYRAPLLDWWATLTDGFRKSRLVVEKEPQTLAEVKSWLHQSVGPLLAVVLEQPNGLDWVQRIAKAGKKRWKTKHHRLLEQSGHNGGPAEARPIKSNGS